MQRVEGVHACSKVLERHSAFNHKLAAFQRHTVHFQTKRHHVLHAMLVKSLLHLLAACSEWTAAKKHALVMMITAAADRTLAGSSASSCMMLAGPSDDSLMDWLLLNIGAGVTNAAARLLIMLCCACFDGSHQNQWQESAKSESVPASKQRD